MTLSLQIFWNQSYIDLCSQTTTIQSHSLNNQLHSTYHLGILWIPFLETWRDWFILTFPSLSCLSCMTQGVQLHRTHVSTLKHFLCKTIMLTDRLYGTNRRDPKKAMSTDGGRGGGDTAVHRWVSFGCKNWQKQHFLWIWLLQPSTRLTSSLELSCASRMAGAGKPELRHLSPRSIKNSVAPRRKRSRRMVCLRRVWRKPWTCWEWTRQSSRLRAQCLWVCLTDGPH